MLHFASHYLKHKMLFFSLLALGLRPPTPPPTHTPQSAATSTQHKSGATWFSPNHWQDYRAWLHFHHDSASNCWRRFFFLPSPPLSSCVCLSVQVYVLWRSLVDLPVVATHTRTRTNDVYWHSAGCSAMPIWKRATEMSYQRKWWALTSVSAPELPSSPWGTPEKNTNTNTQY